MLTKRNALTITAAFLLLNTAVLADEIHVYEGESIQAVIDASSDGDEIIVHPGTYYEAIDFVGKAVWLHSSDGVDATTLDATGLDASVVSCVSAKASIRSLKGLRSLEEMGLMMKYWRKIVVAECITSRATPQLETVTLPETKGHFLGQVFLTSGTVLL